MGFGVPCDSWSRAESEIHPTPFKTFDCSLRVLNNKEEQARLAANRTALR